MVKKKAIKKSTISKLRPNAVNTVITFAYLVIILLSILIPINYSAFASVEPFITTSLFLFVLTTMILGPVFGIFPLMISDVVSYLLFILINTGLIYLLTSFTVEPLFRVKNVFYRAGKSLRFIAYMFLLLLVLTFLALNSTTLFEMWLNAFQSFDIGYGVFMFIYIFTIFVITPIFLVFVLLPSYIFVLLIYFFCHFIYMKFEVHKLHGMFMKKKVEKK